MTLSKVFQGIALPDSVFCFTSPTVSATVFRVGSDAGGKHGISCCAHYVLISWFMCSGFVQGSHMCPCMSFVLSGMEGCEITFVLSTHHVQRSCHVSACHVQGAVVLFIFWSQFVLNLMLSLSNHLLTVIHLLWPVRHQFYDFFIESVAVICIIVLQSFHIALHL